MSVSTPSEDLDPETGDATTKGKPIHVLLVEDDPDYARLVQTTLAHNGSVEFEVDHFERLVDALGRLEDQRYDVMLLDLSLPDGYGAFTVGCACSLARHLPVLVLTATEDNELARKAVRAGAQDYLVKHQIDRKALPQLILRAVERYAHTDRLLAMGERQAERAALRCRCPPRPRDRPRQRTRVLRAGAASHRSGGPTALPRRHHGDALRRTGRGEE